MSLSKSALIKIVSAIVGLAVAIIVSNITPPEGLTPKAMMGVGIFLCAIIFWMTEAIPDYMTSLLMCVAWAAFKVVPFGTAFAAYQTTSFWLILGALGIATAVGQSGLLGRIALIMMNRFPLTFKGQTMGLMLTGLIVSPLIPSGTTKTALMAPFAQAISDGLGYPRKSNGAAGLFGAMFVSIGCMHLVFLSGSFACYLILGLMPVDIQAQLSWGLWLRNASIWAVVVLVLSYIFIQFIYKPAQGDQKTMTTDVLKKQKEALGPLSRNEKIVIVVLVCSILLWITERMHGVSSTVVALCALGVLVITNVLSRSDFRSKITWDALIFIGGILCVASVFPAIGIDKWLSNQLGPIIVPLMQKNIYLFLVALAVCIYLLRFIVVSQTALITIFTVLLTPFAVNAGISPWIMGFTVFASVNVWNTKYMSATYLTAFYAVVASGGGNELITYKQAAKMSYAYSAISILGLLASVPFWKLFGMIG